MSTEKPYDAYKLRAGHYDYPDAVCGSIIGRTVCAWCERERGESPKPTDSHGICRRHRDALLAEYRGDVATQVARTYRDLRVERNDRLEDVAVPPMRLWTWAEWKPVLAGVVAGALVLGFCLLAWFATGK